jgi:hypothetical protein
VTLIQDCQNDKLTVVALHKLAQECALNLGLPLEGSLSKICSVSEINRTQVYERKKQLEEALSNIELTGPGRPACPPAFGTVDRDAHGWQLCEQVLRFRLGHPGALVLHAGGHATYSDGFIRFILNLHDSWEGTSERFCEQAEIPYPTFRSWNKKDREEPYEEHRPRPRPALADGASIAARLIAEDYAVWEGSLRDFLKYEGARMQLAPTAIRRVLAILGMVAVRSGKGPRYRGSTEQCLPGSILVTDGKTVQVVCTGTGEVNEYNWQGIIDQATTCHTAVVVTETECAAGVRQAFDASCKFIGRPPQALVHDNKPIHDELALRDHVEKTTIMIPATPARGENKAGMEGEFGKFEQTVGAIYLDDSSVDRFKKTAVSEVLRAYTAGLNHAGRFEFGGESREGVLRKTCPDTEKDRRFIEQLHADHTKKRRPDQLATKGISRTILDEGFKRFEITDLDPEGRIREWLSGRFTPAAISQGLAIFGTERDKRRLRSKTAHRYLVKVIQNCQHELDLRREEELLREYAGVERSAWLQILEVEWETLVSADDASPETDLVHSVAEKALFGGLILQRAFWENKLKGLLEKQRGKFTSVCSHVRRIFETTWENRFALISKLVTWEYQLAA